MSDVYNPLSMLNLGKSVAEALLDREWKELDDLEPFEGAGIYAIYCRTDREPYKRLAILNRDEWRIPIYIGKAIPSGGRRGKSLLTGTKGRFVHSRLAEHADSIRSADGLDIKDFAVRWLIVDDIWIPLGETLLIRKFQPLWNVMLDGFGNHNPGSGRHQGKRPRWDVLHPGRKWAANLQDRKETQDELRKEAKIFLDKQKLSNDPRISFDPQEIA